MLQGGLRPNIFHYTTLMAHPRDIDPAGAARLLAQVGGAACSIYMLHLRIHGNCGFDVGICPIKKGENVHSGPLACAARHTEGAEAMLGALPSAPGRGEAAAPPACLCRSRCLLRCWQLHAAPLLSLSCMLCLPCTLCMLCCAVQARRAYEVMQEEGVAPNTHFYTAYIGLCSRWAGRPFFHTFCNASTQRPMDVTYGRPVDASGGACAAWSADP